MRIAVRWALLGCTLAWGMGGIFPGRHEAPEAAVQDQKAAGWLIYWAEGLKAAQQTGKPIFMVFR